MKKLSLALLMAFAIGACAGTQTKTRSVLDSLSGALVMANSFVKAVESLPKWDWQSEQVVIVLDALIGAKQHLLMAAEYLEAAYELNDTNPQAALEYAACSEEAIVDATTYLKKLGIGIPKSLIQSVTSIKSELKGVVCGKLL